MDSRERIRSGELTRLASRLRTLLWTASYPYQSNFNLLNSLMQIQYELDAWLSHHHPVYMRNIVVKASNLVANEIELLWKYMNLDRPLGVAGRKFLFLHYDQLIQNVDKPYLAAESSPLDPRSTLPALVPEIELRHWLSVDIGINFNSSYDDLSLWLLGLRDRIGFWLEELASRKIYHAEAASRVIDRINNVLAIIEQRRSPREPYFLALGKIHRYFIRATEAMIEKHDVHLQFDELDEMTLADLFSTPPIPYNPGDTASHTMLRIFLSETLPGVMKAASPHPKALKAGLEHLLKTLTFFDQLFTHRATSIRTPNEWQNMVFYIQSHLERFARLDLNPFIAALRPPSHDGSGDVSPEVGIVSFAHDTLSQLDLPVLEKNPHIRRNVLEIYTLMEDYSQLLGPIYNLPEKIEALPIGIIARAVEIHARAIARVLPDTHPQLKLLEASVANWRYFTQINHTRIDEPYHTFFIPKEELLQFLQREVLVWRRFVNENLR